MVALFAALPAEHKREIPADAIEEAQRLYEEFQLYVIRTQALRKVFASIKGYYFQVEIMGSTITWLSPHQFTQHLPSEVDFRVMLTFLEFHRCVAKFVNFRLYKELNVAYPPKRDDRREDAASEVAALEVEMSECKAARDGQASVGDKEDAEAAAEVAADFGEQS